MNYLMRNFLKQRLASDKTELEVAHVKVHEGSGPGNPESDACSWKVTLGPLIPIPLDGLLSNGAADPTWGFDGPKCKLRWGGGQANFDALLDWDPRGMSFVVHSHEVIVILQNVPDAVYPPRWREGGTAAGLVNLFAAATIRPHVGPRDNRNPPVVTQRTTIGGATTTPMRIPRWARRVRYYSTGDPPPANSVLRLAFTDDGAATVFRYNPPAGNADFPVDPYILVATPRNITVEQAIDIPPYANWMQITTTAAADINWVFELDLG